MMKPVIAYWVIANVASLNVYDMHNDEAVLAGINDDQPEWCEIKYQDFYAEDLVSGIDFHGSFYRLDECMKVRVF